MRRTDRDHIRALPLFRNITQAHFNELMRAGRVQHLPARVTLVNEGEPSHFLHIIMEGTVELYCSNAGREITVDIIYPHTVFILAAVIRNEPYLSSARTLTEANILMLPSETVRRVLGSDAAFACAIAVELAARYNHIVQALMDQKLRSGAERLAKWILDTERQQGNQGRIVLPYDKRTLAAYLGMTPENLSRNLAMLTNHGVSGSGREIVITDRRALRSWATPVPPSAR
jgi:CRP/FNR family transcriptional activator FtrB